MTWFNVLQKLRIPAHYILCCFDLSLICPPFFSYRLLLCGWRSCDLLVAGDGRWLMAHCSIRFEDERFLLLHFSPRNPLRIFYYYTCFSFSLSLPFSSFECRRCLDRAGRGSFTVTSDSAGRVLPARGVSLLKITLVVIGSSTM